VCNCARSWFKKKTTRIKRKLSSNTQDVSTCPYTFAYLNKLFKRTNSKIVLNQMQVFATDCKKYEKQINELEQQILQTTPSQ